MSPGRMCWQMVDWSVGLSIEFDQSIDSVLSSRSFENRKTLMDSSDAVELLSQGGVTLRKGKLGNVLVVDTRSAELQPAEQVDSWAAATGQLPKVRELYLTGQPVADHHVSRLIDALPGLQVLDLEGTLVTDAIFEDVVKLSKLKMLALTKTSVSETTVRDYRKRMIQTRIVKLD